MKGPLLVSNFTWYSVGMLGPEHPAWNTRKTRNARNTLGWVRFILRLANYRRFRCPRSWAHPTGGRSPFRALPFAQPPPPPAAALQTAIRRVPEAAFSFLVFRAGGFHRYGS